MSTTQQEQTRAAAPQEYLLEMRGITKAFAGVQALKGVDFYVRPGTVHALMGENGAGKSTLMKCLFGIYHKDEGTIKLRGQEVNFQSPHEALLNGISMVHQELEQVPERSVMENVWLGRFPKKFGLIDTAKMVKDTEAVRATLGGEVKIDPRARLSSLTVSKRQMVDIAKAVSYNCDIIALDEPTSSLNEKEVDILMEIIDGLRRQGKGIIYISHKMEEIFRIADDITVMRDGALIKTMRAAETNVDEVIRLMVGRELTDRFPPKQGTIGKEILVVKDLNDLGHHIHDISFDLHEGEVLGIAGLLGAGRTELLETLFGARTRESGTVTLKGNGIGADEVMECSGAADSPMKACKMARKTGKVALIATYHAGDVMIPANTVNFNELTIVGSKANPNVSEQVLHFFSTGAIQGDKLVTHTFPLEDYEKAVDIFEHKKDGSIKVVINP